MAIFKSVPWQNGINAEYWCVDEFEIKYPSKEVVVVVHGYISEKNKKLEDGKKIMQRTVVITGDDFDFAKTENAIDKIYEKLTKSKKEMEQFRNDKGETFFEEVEKNFFAGCPIA